MRVGVIGGGIVGSAIAATIKKYQYGYQPVATATRIPNNNVEVTIIDDKRKHQTSQAGQGYLWSIHRCPTSTSTDTDTDTDTSFLEYSIKAKEAWVRLLNAGGNDKADLLLEKRGSLLVAPSSSREELLAYFDIAKDLLGITTSACSGVSETTTSNSNIQFLSDASSCNKILLPSVCGIQYTGNDYTCSPPAMIHALMEMYDIKHEYRTVDNLEIEKEKYDCVICTTGPWMNELKHDAGVKPIRGVLVELSPGSSPAIIEDDDCMIPMMEFGYGSLGTHFTLSSRENSWLLGASREDVSFSTDGIDEVVTKLIRRSHEFVHKETFLGCNYSKKIGFRPSLQQHILSKSDETHSQDRYDHPFQIKDENDVIFCYGFEG
jgi:glycine/D-amino acid oxidase-like deaminating enzyme